MKFADPIEAVHVVFGFASIIANMVDQGLDPLVDTDVEQYLRATPIEITLTDEDIKQAVKDFYETYDMLLDA